MIYILIIVLLLFLSNKYDGKIAHGNRIYWIICVLLICLVGFSRDIGGDKANYENAFYYCATWADGWPAVKQNIIENFLFGYMPLWSLFLITCKTISSEFFITQFVLALLVNTIFFSLFKQYSRRKFLCVLIYFVYCYYDFNFDILRRGLAISFGVLALKELPSKKFIKYYLFAVIALLFHVASFILFFLPFIRSIRFTTKRIILISLFSIGLYFVISTFLLNAINSFSTFTGISRYNSYIESSLNIFGLLFSVIKFIIIPWIVIFMLQNSKEIMHTDFHPIISAYFSTCVLLIPITTLSYCFDFFSVFAIILFVDFICIYLRHKNFFKRLSCCMITLLIILRCYNYYTYLYGEYENYRFFYPYTSIFDNKNTYYREIMRAEGFANDGIDNERK